MMKKITFGMMAMVLLMAAGMVTAAEPQGWQLEVTPYLWMMGIDGDVTLHGQKVDFDRSSSDVFDAADIGGSLLAVAQCDRFLLWGQVDYLSLDTDNLDVEDQPQGGNLQSDMILGEAAVGYQVDGWSEGQTFDLLIGVRALHIENDLDVYGQGSYSRDNDVVDPILVVRPSLPVLPSKIKGLRFNPTLAIGGGGDSKLVYEMQPQFQYQINANIAARVGYRVVGYKFDGDNADDKLNLTEDDELNFELSGLILGLGVTF